MPDHQKKMMTFYKPMGNTKVTATSGQRLLIWEYLKQCHEIILSKEYCDDGFSGAKFQRPQFQKMMEDVKMGVIDCIIVKEVVRIPTWKIIRKRFSMRWAFSSLLSMTIIMISSCRSKI